MAKRSYNPYGHIPHLKWSHVELPDDMLREIEKIRSEPDFAPDPPDKRVYFIQRGHKGPIKIGQTYDVHKRLKSIQSHHTDDLILLGDIQGGPIVEAQWHEHFARYRIRGEWFRPVPSLLRAIKDALAIDA